LNVGITVVCIKLFPEIHLIKFLSAFAYIIQPVIMNRYVRKNFVIDKNVNADENILKNRWSGFGINIANIITTNTDVIVLTLFSNLVTVSIYTIYFSIVNSLKNLIMSIGYGYQSLTGQQIANHEKSKLNYFFDQYEFVIFNISGVAFSACIALIVPFIMIYTTGVKDANYQQPLFAFLICLALYILSIREPYIIMTYNAGLFRETQKYAYIEAILNIAISVILVNAFGLIGVAIGTAISAFYRYISTLLFLKNNVLERSVWISIRKLIIFMIPFFASLIFGYHLMHHEFTLIQWIIQAILFTCISLAFHVFIDLIFYRDQVKSLIKK
jgi:O-antigen/teichoic acid export membrane protein